MAQTLDLTKVTLAVLAGGRGSRMGIPKAHLLLGDKPILQYLLERWNWPGPTLLVTAPGREHPPGCQFFKSEAVDPSEQGPLRGVLTAIEYAETEQLVITTVDMPAIGQENLRWISERLLEEGKLQGAMIQRIAQGQPVLEPFPLACNIAARSVIARQLVEGNRAVHALSELDEFITLKDPNWSQDVWTNLNSPTDYADFLRKNI